MSVTIRRLRSLVLVALLTAGCARDPAPDGSGTIECTQVRLAAETGGRLIRFTPQEGDRVTAGQVLAEIDPTPYALKLDEARAGLAQTQAQLDLILAGSRDEDIQRAREQVREAKARADAAALDAQRLADVFTRGSIAAKQRDDAAAAAEQTAAALAATEQQLARLLAGSRKEEVRLAQAAVDLAKTRVAQAEKAVSDCVVKSPINATVSTRTVEPGEVIAPGAPLAVLSDLTDTWLSVYVPEEKLARVKVGQKAWVRIDGDPAAHEGTVRFVAPEAEFTPRNVQTPDERTKLVYRIKIAIPNPQGIFKPGMPADGYLEPR